MERNILAAGKDTLLEIREQVLELDGCRTRAEELTQEESKLERAVTLREKQMNEEIADTIKKRRNEVMVTFQKEEGKLQEQQKKLRAKKEKYKSGKMSERIKSETAGLVEENRELAAEARSAFKQSRTPRILNSALYYGLFMPKNAADLLICMVAFVILFVLAPIGLHQILPEAVTRFWWHWVLIYVMLILLFGGLYVLIHNKTKAAYGETLVKGRRIRGRIRLNKRTMAKIRRQIRRDKDESVYGLEHFDEEIAAVQVEAQELAQRKKDALAYFESTTKGAITEEIRGRILPEIERMKEEHDAIRQTLKSTQDKVKQKSLYVAENYEALLGKEFISATVLSRLLELLEQGRADSIGAALALYKAEGKL